MMPDQSAKIAALEAELAETYRSVTELTNELTIANEGLERLSLYDDLTGLANRTLYQDRFELAREAAYRKKQPLLILLMDLNRFKEINDTLGHEAGDKVLQTVAKRIKQRLRSSDTVARMGGDEFAFVLPLESRIPNASRVAQELVEVVQLPIQFGEQLVDVGASIGVAQYPDDGDDLVTLLGKADRAMYQAKRRGGGFRFHDDTQDGVIPQRPHFFASDLRNAVKQDQLEFYYQPKIDMNTLNVSGLEALVRWRHPEKGLIMPDDFIPLAESSSLIMPFTRKTVAMAVRQIMLWQASGIKHAVAVNLSPRSLHDPALVDDIIEFLSEWRQLSEYLVFEVTETALMADPEASVRALNQLAALGVAISIDDFGTGYSSLAYLSDLPLQEMKIDRSFVAKMYIHKEDLAIVRSMIDLAHKLDLTVVAEGIESHEDWATLADLGCNHAQGYYISKPVPAKDLEAWNHSWNARCNLAGNKTPSAVVA